MLSAVTFNGICVKPNQDRHIIATDKDIVVAQKAMREVVKFYVLVFSFKYVTSLNLPKTRRSKEL